jgi:Protein of unknown function (DUF1553)/Protein of unknown function (DUF1549)/Planctomycete cytochrome C
MPRTLVCFTAVGLIATLCPLRALGRPDDPRASTVDFNRDIRPILSKNCFACHGQDSARRAGKVRLDRRESAVQKRKHGVAIVPGRPTQSDLLRRVRATDEAERMPPTESGNHLTGGQITLLERWIEEGAPYAEHWSFVKPTRWPLPVVKDATWPQNPIDHFVLARLEKAGLKPSPPADRFASLRRLSLDLRGLPPTHEEISAFASDPSPDAYERAVDKMLADPAYGERWARVWLDLARYADSAGYGSDPLRTIWRYRDWAIDAFNRNLPYDQFLIEQLAGDLLPNPTIEQKMATAFHRNTMTNTEGGTDREEFRVAAVKDRVDTTLQIAMGLTMGCAKCHDHKYDPITQKDYYRFYAFFNQSADADRPDEAPVIPVPSPEVAKKNHEIDVKIGGVERSLISASFVVSLVVERFPVLPAKALIAFGEIKRLNQSRPAIPTLPVMVELPAGKQRETRVMVKGSFLSLGDRVEAGVPAAFHPLPERAPASRLGVALWLVDRNNPLTARVAVNRLWAQLFGVGLVETEEDFGTQGELPTHPELLDWLATEYVRLGWDTRALLRLIVTSATYRQSAKVTPDRLAKDPRNRLLSRGSRFRLDAEMIRDQALALSGLLSPKMHGPSVFPPQPPGLWQAAFNGQRTWATSQGDDRHRRGLYTFWRRTVPYPSIATFDAPSREVCVVRRIRTNTPLQAFVTLNDPVYVETAQALARRIVREGGCSDEARACFGLGLCLARPPTQDEVRQLTALLDTERAHYRANARGASEIVTDPIGPLPAGVDAVELAAWTIAANVLLNLDGVLTKS